MKKKYFLTVLLTLGFLVLGAGSAFATTAMVDLDSAVACVDGETCVMDSVAGMNSRGDILVPVRDIAKLFDGNVAYDPVNRKVMMTFDNGYWAIVYIGEKTDGRDEALFVDEDGIIRSVGAIANDRLYLPAEVMAICIGGSVEYVDFDTYHIHRLIFHVR